MVMRGLFSLAQTLATVLAVAMALAFLPLLLPATRAAAADPAPERFEFRSADGIHDLSAVRYPVANPKGVIVLVVGRSESWLKHGALCRELNHAGYTVYSYDHRGQGLSPRLLGGNPEIGHVDKFAFYASDLGLFLGEVRRREGTGPLFLIGHSMGAAVIVDRLSEHPDPGIRKIVLCSPMFRISTAPWPEPLARLVLGALHVLGKGTAYAPGEGDALPDEPFERNRVTSSRDRWREILSFRSRHPAAVTGGASVDWVLQALDGTTRLRKALRKLGPGTLILEAGRDELVVPFHPEPSAVGRGPLVVRFPEARHELLMEREPIRGQALRTILAFLGSPGPSEAFTLDQSGRNRLFSESTPFLP